MKVILFLKGMKGDILIIDENHQKAAHQIVGLIMDELKKSIGKLVISVAGESGAGKSEIAAAMAQRLEEFQFRSIIFGQDDYFKLPPHTNAREREKNISWVGPQEVKLDLLDQNILDFLNDKLVITKPLVDFNADLIGMEKIQLDGYQVLIAEGTYTTLLENVNSRVFIDRNKLDTIESRKKRAREKQDDFLDRILTIEHNIISKHKELADIIVTKQWNAEKRDKKQGSRSYKS
jgi:uridine kinase